MRDSRDPHVAITSPIPASPANVEPVRAGRRAQPDHLGQAAGHQPGLAVVPEAQPVGGAGSDRDDVLERPAQLHAQDVAIDVQPELTAAEPFGHTLGELDIVGRDDRRRGQSLGDLARQVGAGQGGDPPRVYRTGLGDHLAHPEQRAVLEALDHRQDVRRPRDGRRDLSHDGTEMRRRDGEQNEVRRRAEGRRIGRGDERLRQLDT